MSIPEHARRVRFRVPFNHCDPLQVVWHGRYFEYFEEARTELMRSIDLDVEDMQRLGYKLFVVDAKVRWMNALLYGDEAECTAWFVEPNPHVRMAFDLRNLTRGGRSARGTMTFATTTMDGRLLTEIPHLLLERIPELSGLKGTS
ncbi:MAG: acyl-CoA thioesterase [Myxococcota bacterium]